MKTEAKPQLRGKEHKKSNTPELIPKVHSPEVGINGESHLMARSLGQDYMDTPSTRNKVPSIDEESKIIKLGIQNVSKSMVDAKVLSTINGSKTTTPPKGSHKIDKETEISLKSTNLQNKTIIEKQMKAKHQCKNKNRKNSNNIIKVDNKAKDFN
jgi:hypothetical protein